jgi:hypothetical protein
VLESHDVTVVRERSSRNEPLDEAGARALLRSVTKVWIARGRKVEEHAAESLSPDDLKGPTGNFRAPIVRRGKTLLVGLHRETLEKVLER